MEVWSAGAQCNTAHEAAVSRARMRTRGDRLVAVGAPRGKPGTIDERVATQRGRGSTGLPLPPAMVNEAKCVLNALKLEQCAERSRGCTGIMARELLGN